VPRTWKIGCVDRRFDHRQSCGRAGNPSLDDLNTRADRVPPLSPQLVLTIMICLWSDFGRRGSRNMTKKQAVEIVISNELTSGREFRLPLGLPTLQSGSATYCASCALSHFVETSTIHNVELV
jgi:hypothetical protein